MDATVITELLKLSLSTYFAIAKASGATEEEIEKTYQEEKAKFIANAPNKLEDV